MLPNKQWRIPTTYKIMTCVQTYAQAPRSSNCCPSAPVQTVFVYRVSFGGGVPSKKKHYFLRDRNGATFIHNPPTNTIYSTIKSSGNESTFFLVSRLYARRAMVGTRMRYTCIYIRILTCPPVPSFKLNNVVKSIPSKSTRVFTFLAIYS